MFTTRSGRPVEPRNLSRLLRQHRYGSWAAEHCVPRPAPRCGHDAQQPRRPSARRPDHSRSRQHRRDRRCCRCALLSALLSTRRSPSFPSRAPERAPRTRRSARTRATACLADPTAALRAGDRDDDLLMWERRSLGYGSHKERVCDWTAARSTRAGLPGGWGHWLPVRQQTTRRPHEPRARPRWSAATTESPLSQTAPRRGQRADRRAETPRTGS